MYLFDLILEYVDVVFSFEFGLYFGDASVEFLEFFVVLFEPVAELVDEFFELVENDSADLLVGSGHLLTFVFRRCWFIYVVLVVDKTT